jgi:tetratricopeptide (TPR) repeat protein
MGSAYTPPSYGAYVEWVQATAHLGADPREAERHYRRSLQLDPGYIGARYGLCLALADQGRFADADAELRILEEPATYSQATPLEQAIIRARRARHDGDLGGELQAYTEAARLSPTPFTLHAVAAAESYMHHPRAALEVWSRIRVADSPAEFGPAASYFLTDRATLYHEVGEYEKQLETARLGQQHYPADGVFFSHEVGAMVALGRVTELDAVMARAERSTLRSGSVGAVLYHSTRELSAHGHADAARAMASRAATWHQNRLEAREPTPQLRRTYALALLLAGECRQALAIGRDLVRQEPDSLDALGTHATVLASCGSRAEAQTIAEDLARLSRPFQPGEHLYQRARVLAALGDGDGAVRALQAAFAQGKRWRSTEMHLDVAWNAIRRSPPFVELMKPKG